MRVNITFMLYNFISHFYPQNLCYLRTAHFYFNPTRITWSRNCILFNCMYCEYMRGLAIEVFFCQRSAIVDSSIALPTIFQIGPYRCTGGEQDTTEDDNFLFVLQCFCDGSTEIIIARLVGHSALFLTH